MDCGPVRPFGVVDFWWWIVWRKVDSLLAWIAPIDPVNPIRQLKRNTDRKEGVPVIAIAKRANPLYRPTPASRAIPVPLEMSIAPIYH
jgi:hypothetical protein